MRSFYFPTGLAVSPKGTSLYVVNSNFDLQYTAGTVQVLDLIRLRSLVPRPWENADCQTAGLAASTGADRLLRPGPCAPLDLNAPPDGGDSVLRSTVEIGAFATDAYLALRPVTDAQPGARLLIPVRGDPSLTWIDVDDDRYETPSFTLSCGQPSTSLRCGPSHRAGTDSNDNPRALTLPAEPFGLSATEDNAFVAITHQTTGSVSLFQNGWGTPPAASSPCATAPTKPELAFIFQGLPQGTTGISSLPLSRSALSLASPSSPSSSPSFLVSFRNASQVTTLTTFDACAAAPQPPLLVAQSSVSLRVAPRGADSRGVAIDDRARRACEATCSDEAACLQACGALPLNVFLASRDPSAVLVGQTIPRVSERGTNNVVRFFEQISVAQGVSRIQLGHVLDREGKPQPRVFATCFDARLVYVIDPDRLSIEGVVTTGRGPSALAFDPGTEVASSDAAFGYLAHFTDSYLGVIDLDQRHPQTYLSLIATMGIPTPPQESR